MQNFIKAPKRVSKGLTDVVFTCSVTLEASLQNREKKLLVSSCLTIRLSTRNSSVSIAWIFMKFYITVFFETLLRKFNFHYNRIRIQGTLHEDQYTCLSYLAQFFLEREMFQTKVVEKIKTHILGSVNFIFENLTLYEIMWKNTVEPGTIHRTTWRMRIACCISWAINTLSDCVIFLFSHCNNRCTNAPHCYLIRLHIACIVSLLKDHLKIRENGVSPFQRTRCGCRSPNN
jgi:hypothetical protein